MSESMLLPTGAARLKFFQAIGAPISDEENRERRLLTRLQTAACQYNAEAALPAVAWEVARLDSKIDPADRPALLLLLTAVLLSEKQGNTRLPVGAGFEYLPDMLQLLLGDDCHALTGWEAPRLHEKIIALTSDTQGSDVLGGPDDYKPLLVSPPYVWSHKMRLLEQRFVSRLRRFCQPLDVDEQTTRQAIDAVVKPRSQTGVRLNAKQQEAVSQAVRSRLCIISGGPGTGKTTIVVSILRSLARAGVELSDVALAAPTGKAANRMAESIRIGLARVPHSQLTEADWRIQKEIGAAQTLHRLLGYSPREDRFRHHENNPLAESVVIVDEASMIDMYLMERLVSALRSDARLILLGDAEQLPSVDAGAVLRDLTESAKAPGSLMADHVVRLEESMRMDPSDPQGRQILLTANRVNSGSKPRTVRADEMLAADADYGVALLRKTPEEIAFKGVEFLPAAGADAKQRAAVRDALLQRWYDRFFDDPEFHDLATDVYELGENGFSVADAAKLQQLLDRLSRCRILCLTRAYRTGSEIVNEDMHFRLQRTRKTRGAALLPGEPVLVTQNDYEKKIFNGDQGMVVNVRRHGAEHLMVVFPSGAQFTPFHVEALRGQISLAYAMTVHKSQGSEFDHALIMAPERDLPINTRELLYTAITRCKKSVVLHGSDEIVAAGCKRRIDRFTGIAEALR